MPAFLEFVIIPPGLDPAPVGGLGQGLGGQVYREFAVFPDESVGVPLRPDGNVADGRVRAQDPRPSHRNQVVVFLARPAAHQDRRQWINHRPRFEVHFAFHENNV